MDIYRFVYWILRSGYRLRCWMQSYLTPIGLGVVVLALLSGGVGLWSSRSLCHLLFFLSISLLCLALIGRRFVQFSFTAERRLPRFGTVGEALSYRIFLKNKTSQVQAGLKLIDVMPTSFLTLSEFLQLRSQHVAGGKWLKVIRETMARRQWAIASLTELPVIRPNGKAEISSEMMPLKRGRLVLNHLTLMATDPLGLVYQRQIVTHAQSVCILPQRYELPPMFSVQNRAHQMGEAVLTSSVGESLEFRALRDYRPGDPTNKIHWKSWAKVGRPIVKEQQDESAVHHGLILDTFDVESESLVFEEMLAIATSLLMQPQGDMTLLDVIFASHDLRCVTAGAGTRQKELLLEMIATMTPCLTHSFQDLVLLSQSRLSRLSSCVCLFIHWDTVRQQFLEQIVQSPVPTKAIVLCQGQQSHEGLRYISLSHTCTVYFISIYQIQQDLLQL